MNKLFLLGALCLAQLSFASAKDFSTDLKDRSVVYAANFQELSKPVIIKTKKFKIKITKQANDKYLYQSWKANSSLTAKPDLVIKDGEYTPDGSGGNYHIDFTDKGYTYQVWRNYLTNSAKTPPYTLVVKDSKDKEIVNQGGQIVKK